MIAKKIFHQSVIQELQGTIAAQRPSSLIYCTDTDVPAMSALAETGVSVDRAGEMADLDHASRYELGVVFNFLEHRPVSEGLEVLGRLRNVHCERIWVAVTTSSDWDFNSMISLGFSRGPCFAGRTMTSAHNKPREVEICTYHYDIDKYNHKREWNTPKHWANPENWGKYWW